MTLMPALMAACTTAMFSPSLTSARNTPAREDAPKDSSDTRRPSAPSRRYGMAFTTASSWKPGVKVSGSTPVTGVCSVTGGDAIS